MENKNEITKKPSKFVHVLKAIFVRNIGYKITAVITSIVIWLAIVGLGI